MNLNNLAYKVTLPKEHLELLDKDGEGFKEFPIENFLDRPFPLNLSRETRKEIETVGKLKPNPSFVESTDDVHSHFKKVFDEHGLKYDKDKWHNIGLQTLPIIMKIKYHYNRPRPKQLADVFEMELDPVYLESAETPSYPSGHSTQARFLSLLIADEFPQIKEQILDAGKQIGMGRLVAKVHYPTDHTFGVELGDALYRHYNSIKKADMNDNIEKGRALPVGTIKKRGSNNFIKTASGWKYHSRANKKSGEAKESQPKKDTAEPTKNEPTMREVLADPEAKFMVETIEEYVSDLRDDPGRKEHMEGLKSAVEELERMTGFKYDISDEEKNYKRAKNEGSSEIRQSRKFEPGSEPSKILSRYNSAGLPGLMTAQGKKDMEEGLKRMTATARGIALAKYTRALKKDQKKVESYRRIPADKAMGVGITIKNLQRNYNGTTTAKWGNKEVKISPQDKMTVNGKIVEVDDDSSYVKLGGGGRGSASGGMYPAGHFDGQLQGRDYVFAANRIMHDLREGKSPRKIKEENKDRRGFKELLDHLGLK